MILLAGLVGGLVPGVAATAAPAAVGAPSLRAAAPLDHTPVTGAVFNRPIGTRAQQYAIFDEINRTIDSTPGGATIRFAVYSFAEMRTANKLIAAHDRGVKVKLIFNNHHIYDAERRLVNALGTDPDARSFVTLCDHSCRGTSGGNMHNKLFLFSQAGAARYVVMTGSNNMTRHNAVAQWADMYAVVDDVALYRTFVGVFDQMKYDVAVTPSYMRAEVNGYEAQFYPDAKVAMEEDPVYQALGSVVCVGATDGAGRSGFTTLKISMHAWNGLRGRYLAQRIAELRAAGCRIRVILGVGYGKVVRAILEEAGVNLSFGTVRGVRTHQKLMILNGVYGDNTAARIVWTGSHNWSDGALRRDDVIFRVEGWEPFVQYRRNFGTIWREG